MAYKFSLHPAHLAQVLQSVLTAIGSEPNWPASAPTAAEVGALRDEVRDAYRAVKEAEAALSVARAHQRKKIRESVAVLTRVDDATDLLYGRRGSRKWEFGLRPDGKPQEEIERLKSIRFQDGGDRGCIRVDWEAIDGASYEIQWSLDPTMIDIEGSAVATASEFEIKGLEATKVYWIWMRPVRGGKVGPWSMPYARVAPF